MKIGPENKTTAKPREATPNCTLVKLNPQRLQCPIIAQVEINLQLSCDYGFNLWMSEM
jgi:hypothetical protein